MVIVVNILKERRCRAVTFQVYEYVCVYIYIYDATKL
jgi:hypothetical protein